jgi:hypothetical protein
MQSAETRRRYLRLFVVGCLVFAALPARFGRGQDAPGTAAPAAASAPATEAAGEAPAAEGEKPAADAKAEDGETAEGEKAEPAKEYPKPEKVTVGVHVNDIQAIDLKTHTYAIDAYFWFRWQNPDLDPASSMEFVNPTELWGHTVTTNYEKPEELPDGTLYQVSRVQGRFSKKMPLYDYPFDKQNLEVVFEDSVSEAGDMIYVLAEPAVTTNPQLTLPGYVIAQPVARVTEEGYPTNFGDLRNPEPSKYSRVRVDIPVSRPMLAYAVKLLVPVLCVIFGAALMFLFATSYVDSRVDVGITSLLTIVALQMTFNQDVPDVGYLMLMDKVYLCSYLFVIGGLGVVVRTTRLMDQGQSEAGARLTRIALVSLTLTYFGSVALLVGQAIA